MNVEAVDGVATLGRDYTFMCEVIIASDIDEDLAYSVIHNGVEMPLSLPFVVFEPLTLADVGIYQCFVEIASPYLDDPVRLTTEPEEQTITFPCMLCTIIIITHKWEMRLHPFYLAVKEMLVVFAILERNVLTI